MSGRRRLLEEAERAAALMPGKPATADLIRRLATAVREEEAARIPVPKGEGREELGEVLALVDDHDGCHARVRDWNALTDWEKSSEGYPGDDVEQSEWWNRRADAAIAWLEPEGVVPT